MYKKIALSVTLLMAMLAACCVAYAEDTATLAPNPDNSTVIELPTTPPEDIDVTPITPEQRAEAEQAIAEMELQIAAEPETTAEPSVANERAGIIMSSHRKTVGLPTEWVVAVGVGIATTITIVGIAGGRRGRRHR